MHCDALLYDFVFMPCDSLLYNFVLFSLRFCNCYPLVICLSNIMSNIANLSVGRLNSSNISCDFYNAKHTKNLSNVSSISVFWEAAVF